MTTTGDGSKNGQRWGTGMHHGGGTAPGDRTVVVLGGGTEPGTTLRGQDGNGGWDGAGGGDGTGG